jgi:SAM-dependent methyltransferase
MTARCSNCYRAARFLFRAEDWNRRITRESFAYYRCKACGLIFLSPVPVDLGDYYPQDYYTFPRGLAEVVRAAEMERYKIDILRRFKSGGRLLEIGPSWGGFLYLAKQAKFEAEAIEMDPACCDFIRDVVGVPAVQSKDPMHAIRDMGPFDVVALWHVIEHIPEVWDTLAIVAGRVNPGGILVIAAPNPRSLQFQIQGRRWPHVDAPRHVLLAPSSLLADKLRSKGLITVWETTDDPGSRGWNTFGWEYFFMNLSRRMRMKQLLRALGAGISLVLAPLERREGKGSAYTIVFRKEQCL